MAHHQSLTFVIGLAVLGLLLGVAAPPGYAQPKVYEVSAYDVTLELLPDGVYLVTERIAFDFQQGTFTFGTRSIPTDMFDRLSNIQVSSPDAQILEVTTRTDSGDRIIRWTFPERSDPATFTLSYRVYGALVEDDDVNRIDWRAIGEGWSVPIRNVAVTVRIPSELDLAVDDLRVGPADESHVEKTDGRIEIRFQHAQLDPEDGYRVIVEFPKRLDGRPPNEVNWPLVGAVALAVLIGFLPPIALWNRWRARRRESRAVAEPDVELLPAAVLLNGATAGAQRAIPAMLYDLAARGHVTLKRTKEKQRFAGEKPVVRVEFHETADELAEPERRLLNELRQHDTLTEFGRKANRFRRQLLSRARRDLVTQGDLADHGARSMRAWMGGTVALILGIALSAFGGGWWFVALGLGVGLFVGGLVLGGTTYYVPTDQGAQKRADVQAYLDHLLDELRSRERHDPIGAAQFFIDRLPWLALHERVWSKHMDEIKDGLKEADAEDRFDMPPWLQDHTDEAEKGFAPAYASFAACYAVIGDSGGATAAGGAAGGAASAGAGAAGGAGGGGGGAG